MFLSHLKLSQQRTTPALSYIVFVFCFPYWLTAQIDTLVNSKDKNTFASKNLLFQSTEILPIQLEYSSKQIKKETDKEHHIYTDVIYNNAGVWDTLIVSLRARGNFRRKTCYFPPIKMHFKKSEAKNSIFRGHKSLKFVLPCLLQNRSNDDVLKEYLAYKFYEVLAPVYFATRLARIDYVDIRGEKSKLHPLAAMLTTPTLAEIQDFEKEATANAKKTKMYTLLAIMVEDDKKMAKRNDAKVLDRFAHPLMQQENSAIINAFFEFMIGNTDFSSAYQHNQKLVFKDKFIHPVPYDFDLSGLVDASYAVVSNVQNTPLDITEVTQRKYRGIKRSRASFEKVREHFITKQSEINSIFEQHQQLFEDPKAFTLAQKYIASFYAILADDDVFEKRIVRDAR